MKKLLTLALVLVLAFAMSASATNTRVLTMGENNNVLLDDANIWLYPSRINNYPNLAIAEASTFNLGDYYSEGSNPTGNIAQFGVHWKFGTEKPWVMGTYLYSGDMYPFYDFSAASSNSGSGYSYYNYTRIGLTQQEMPLRLEFPYVGNWFDNDVMDEVEYPGATGNRLSLFYGRQLGGWPFGFSFNKFHWSATQEFNGDPDITDDGSHAELGASEYTFGAGVTNPAGTMDVAGSLSFLSWKNRASDGSYNTKPSGNMTFQLNARWFYQVNPTWTLVPNAGVIMGSYGADFYTDDENDDDSMYYKEEISLTNFRLGTGVHYAPTANVLAVADFGFSYYKAKYTDENVGPDDDNGYKNEYTHTFLTLPYLKMGLEAQVFDWMDLRLGATSYWHRWTDKVEYSDSPNSDGKYKYNFPSNASYLGLGFNWNRLHIDTWTDPQILSKGFYFVTGNRTDSDLMNFGVSVLYDMF